MISLNIYIACVYQLHICVYFSQPAGLDGEKRQNPTFLYHKGLKLRVGVIVNDETSGR